MTLQFINLFTANNEVNIYNREDVVSVCDDAEGWTPLELRA